MKLWPNGAQYTRDLEPVGFSEGQRSEQHRLHDREDGRRRADAEREREDGDERKAGPPKQQAQAET